MMQPGTENAIEADLARGDVATAAARAAAALAAGERHPMLLNLAAWAKEEDGDLDGARMLLDEALALSPGDALILTAIAANLRRQGKLSEAIRTIDAALHIEPRHPAIWLERGYVLDAGNSLQAALESYRQAAALDPAMAPALAGVAAMAARTGEHELARAAAGQALAIAPGDPVATAALARIEIEAGDAAGAAARLEALAARPLAPGNRLQVEGLRGDALAKLGEPDAAYLAYAAANRTWLGMHAHLVDAAAPSHCQRVEAIIAGLADTAPWPSLDLPREPGEAARHVFLLGYPRSGNTLVENILASLAGVEAIEERPTLADGEAYLSAEGVARLGTISGHDAMELRAAYWRKVAACGIRLPPDTLVDMDPLKSVQLPLIARLFPAAKVVVMRRDPRDVVWSCFHTNFAPNPSTFEFSGLDRAARHYDAVMRLTELCLGRLTIAPLVLHYEALVGDFDAETRRLCDFAGLDWTPALRGFDRTARRRGVGTASATQVRQGLYNGSGQWRPFAAQMAAMLPILQPWVEAFGYAD